MKYTLSIILLFVSLNLISQEVSLEQKVGRMLIVGFRGTAITDKMDVVKDITERNVGGIILFEHNITPVDKGLNSAQRLKDMCTKITSLADRKIIISVDQEGGKVNRLKTKYGFTRSVTQEYLGKVNNEDTTRYYASRMAQQLSDIGFNTNFTPSVDVNINPLCPVIAKHGRSFSADPYEVIKHGRIVMEEHHKKGIITAIKHFPGHGSSTVDSHLGLTDVTDTWKPEELFPFKELLDTETDNMVMISHVFNRKFDEKYPATLSKKIITGILREELGWNGVIVTDDMHMKAITDNFSFKDALTLTINAGTDMIILSSNLPGNTEPVSQQAIDIIVSQVNAGAISEDRINESYKRICDLLD